MKSMPNKFQARCIKCGRIVPVGLGETWKATSTRWATQHNNCPPPDPPVRPEFMRGGSMYGGFMRGGSWDYGPDECNPNEGDKG